MKRILLSLLISAPFISFATNDLENNPWHTPVTIINSTDRHEIKLSPSEEKCMISNRKDVEIEPSAHYTTMVFDHAHDEAKCQIINGKVTFVRQWHINQAGLENTGVLSYINKITLITDKDGITHETRTVAVKLLNSKPQSSPVLFRQTALLIPSDSTSGGGKEQNIGANTPITKGDSVEIRINTNTNS